MVTLYNKPTFKLSSTQYLQNRYRRLPLLARVDMNGDKMVNSEMDEPLQKPVPNGSPIYIGPQKKGYPLPGFNPMVNKETESFIKLPQSNPKLKRTNRKCCSLAKTAKTIAAFGTYVGLGLLVSIFGSSLLDLETNTNASSDQMALLYTWQNLGRLPAVLLSGVLADKVNKETQIGLAMLALAAVCTSFPFCTNYVVLSTVVALSGSGLGFVGGGSTHYILSLWDAPSAILGLHLSMSLGSTIGPLISRSFLGNFVDDNVTALNNTNMTGHQTPTSNSSYVSVGMSASNASNILKWNLSVDISHDNPGVSPNFIYPYLIMGMFDAFVALLFFILFFTMYQRAQPNTKSVEASEDKTRTKTGTGRARRLVLMILYCMFLFFSGGIEVAYGGLVVIYAYKSLNFAKSTSTVVNAAFFGALSAGRIFGIFITKFGYLRVNIAISISLGVIGMVTLTTLATTHFSIIWISSILIGIAVSTTVGNVLVLTKRSLKLSSHSTSALMFSLYLGMMLVPAAVGAIFKLWGTHIFPYTMLTCISMMVLLFTATILVTRGTIKSK